MHLIELKLPKFLASALINGDYTGLTDEEETTLNLWIKEQSEEYERFWCVSIKDGDEVELVHYHDYVSDGLYHDCCTFIFDVGKKP